MQRRISPEGLINYITLNQIEKVCRLRCSAQHVHTLHIQNEKNHSGSRVLPVWWFPLSPRMRCILRRPRSDLLKPVSKGRQWGEEGSSSVVHKQYITRCLNLNALWSTEADDARKQLERFKCIISKNQCVSISPLTMWKESSRLLNHSCRTNAMCSKTGAEPCRCSNPLKTQFNSEIGIFKPLIARPITASLISVSARLMSSFPFAPPLKSRCNSTPSITLLSSVLSHLFMYFSLRLISLAVSSTSVCLSIYISSVRQSKSIN